VAVEPIPETSEAIDEFGPFDLGEDDLLAQLKDQARQVQDLVPDCVGISLASLEHGVSFTLVASSADIAALDGVQYLDGGPCVEGVKVERVLEYRDEELLGEAGWQLFAQATSAAGVASTLTLPIVVDGQVAGSVNLYAASPHAFAEKHEAIAAIFSAWAPGAVANADLSFSSRGVAEQAPRLLYEELRIHVALGVLVAEQNIGIEMARERLRDAAQRAGTTEAAIAEALIAGTTRGDGLLDQ
jgi:GAF domain-containing protein